MNELHQVLTQHFVGCEALPSDEADSFKYRCADEIILFRQRDRVLLPDTRKAKTQAGSIAYAPELKAVIIAATAVVPYAERDEYQEKDKYFIVPVSSRLKLFQLESEVSEFVIISATAITVWEARFPEIELWNQRVVDDLVALEAAQPVLAVNLDELLGGFGCADWLRAICAPLLASPSSTQRAKGVGHLIRHWKVIKEDHYLLLNWSTRTPISRAKQLAESLDRGVRSAIDEVAAAEASELHEKMANFVHYDVCPEVLTLEEMCVRRDEVESVAALLEPTAEVNGINLLRLEQHALEADIDINRRIRYWAKGKIKHPLLMSTAQNFPAAWWGFSR